jgi:hypothetical protein
MCIFQATIVLMLGNYGQAYPPAPYLLHELIKTWGKQKDPVKSALIFATLKIFFHVCPFLIFNNLYPDILDSLCEFLGPVVDRNSKK